MGNSSRGSLDPLVKNSIPNDRHARSCSIHGRPHATAAAKDRCYSGDVEGGDALHAPSHFLVQDLAGLPRHQRADDRNKKEPGKGEEQRDATMRPAGIARR